MTIDNNLPSINISIYLNNHYVLYQSNKIYANMKIFYVLRKIIIIITIFQDRLIQILWSINNIPSRIFNKIDFIKYQSNTLQI